MDKPELSGLELEELRQLLDGGDRTGYYIRYYELTGSEQALEQAHISSFSGLKGLAAAYANILIEKLLNGEEPGYHPGGVIDFSEDIARSHYDAVLRNHAEGKGGYLSNDEALNEAAQVWEEYDIGDYFPGNVIQAGDAWDEDGIKAWWEEVGTKGAGAAVLGALPALHANMLINPRDYVGENYEWRITVDGTHRYIYDLDEGKVRYIEEQDSGVSDGNLLEKESLSLPEIDLNRQSWSEYTPQDTYNDNMDMDSSPFVSFVPDDDSLADDAIDDNEMLDYE